MLLIFLYSLFEFQIDGWSLISLQYVLGPEVTSLEILPLQLVWRYGYVSCDTRVTSYPSYWGCSDNPVTGPRVNVVITNLSNHILLPPNQFIDDVTNHQTWYTIPGYNSLSPELVLSVFLNQISLSSNQVLRLWCGEDLVNQYEGDNGGRVCADVYSTYDWKDSIKCFYRTYIPYKKNLNISFTK